MIQITDKHNCCGCEACVQACPKGCVSIEWDTEGFLYPHVDSEQCVDCKLCERVCPILNMSSAREPIASFASYNKNEVERNNSSSGGIFIMLAKKTIEDGGVVFGARFDSNWNVVHSYAETQNGITEFMGSKYVQSRIGDSYKKTQDFLKAGRRVLFSGTPCQIAGLKKFLRKEYDNLLTVDFICHGVPSPHVWRSYLNEVKKNVHSDGKIVSQSIETEVKRSSLIGTDEVSIEKISFRDKKTGWKKYSFFISLDETTGDGKKKTVSISQIFRENPYMKSFLCNLILRPSCYNCPSKDGKSGSDITLADFWGIGKYVPDIDDDKGISAVIINSERGLSEFSNLSVIRIPVLFSLIKGNNTAYSKSAYRHPKRESFFCHYDMTITKRADKYAKIPVKKRLIGQCLIVVSSMKKIIKDVIKK